MAAPLDPRVVPFVLARAAAAYANDAVYRAEEKVFREAILGPRAVAEPAARSAAAAVYAAAAAVAAGRLLQRLGERVEPVAVDLMAAALGLAMGAASTANRLLEAAGAAPLVGRHVLEAVERAIEEARGLQARGDTAGALERLADAATQLIRSVHEAVAP